MRTIAYISSPAFADCDTPLLHYLQQEANVLYILQVTTYDKSMTLINIKKLKGQGDVYPASDFSELQNLSKYIDLNKTYVVNMPGKHDYSFHNLMAYFKLYRFLKSKHCDILHLTWPLRYSGFVLYLLHSRMIITMHDPLPHSSNLSHLNLFYRKMAIRLIPRFIILNKCQRQEFISTYRLKEDCVFDSQLSIYTHLHDTSPIYPPNKGYVLFIGSIQPHKGVDVLCQAMQKVHKKFPHLKLIVAGSGKLYFNPRPYLEEGFLEIHNRYLSDGELAGFICRSSFVVCPYIDATQSGVIMSAFALNKPVVATRTGGLPEMVEDGRHGIIIPPKNPDILANAIMMLASEPHRVKQMSLNIAEDYGHGKHSWKHIAEDYEKVYSLVK